MPTSLTTAIDTAARHTMVATPSRPPPSTSTAAPSEPSSSG
ncbi:hypothetical protein ACFYRI_03295 [Streptomyces microflavus]